MLYDVPSVIKWAEAEEGNQLTLYVFNGAKMSLLTTWVCGGVKVARSLFERLAENVSDH